MREDVVPSSMDLFNLQTPELHHFLKLGFSAFERCIDTHQPVKLRRECVSRGKG